VDPSQWTGKIPNIPPNENLDKAKPVRESCSEYFELALPTDVNHFGFLLGGRVMHLVDMAGAIAAMRHAGRPVVTASVDHMDFLHPIHIGQLVILRSSVNRAFHSSMEVGVKVLVEDLLTGQRKHTCSAYLTFVAIDPEGKPAPIPPVLPETEEEKRRYEQAGQRRNHRLDLKKKNVT
jgi:acyl-CoA hydrolase